MNKHELKGYRNCDNNIYSMLPGIQSESPVKYSKSTHLSPDDYRFAVKHLCAPPAYPDNSLGRLVDVNVPRIKPPFKRGSNLFEKTFLVDKMTHDPSLENLRQSEMRENLISKFKVRQPSSMQVSIDNILIGANPLPPKEKVEYEKSKTAFNRRSVKGIKPVMDYSYVPERAALASTQNDIATIE